MNMKRHLFFSGHVQGVGFRFTLQRLALRNHLNGWARNLSDGRVEAFVSGRAEDIDGFLDDLNRSFLGYIADVEELPAGDMVSVNGFHILPSV